MDQRRLPMAAAWLPGFAAVLTALAGVVNVASALTPDIHWRGHLLLHVEGVQAMRIFHALALPAGGALLLISPYLFKRRHRAMRAAVALLLAIGLVNLFKGLDYEESALGWAIAALLYAGRSEFTVTHAPMSLRSAIWRLPLVGALGVALVSFTDWVTSGRPKLDSIMDESSALISFRRGQAHFEDHTLRAFGHVVSFQWMPLAIHLVEVATLLGMAYVLFRPLAAPSAWPSGPVRRRAAALVRQHGQDTLSFRFNVKFQPRWNPRYLAYEGGLGLVRAGVAAMWAEGQMPKPKLPETARIHARVGQRTLKTANR